MGALDPRIRSSAPAGPDDGIPTDLPLELVLWRTAADAHPADLVLWDLTLLLPDEAVEAAHREAATELWGRGRVTPMWWAAVSRPVPITLGLQPDAAEARAMLRYWGVPPTHVPWLLPRYLPALTRARIRQSVGAPGRGGGGRAGPTPAVLTASRRWRVVHGMVAGTHPAHVRARTRASGLDSWIHPGIVGTGLDGTTWQEVLRAARRRGQAGIGLTFPTERSVVISRNPWLVRAGTESGFHVVDCGRTRETR